MSNLKNKGSPVGVFGETERISDISTRLDDFKVDTALKNLQKITQYEWKSRYLNGDQKKCISQLYY